MNTPATNAPTLVTPDWVRLMAGYNAEMNRRIYAAAARMDDAGRRAPRGAFWGSIHATLNHLLWADRIWMHRFAGWPKPKVALPDSADLFDGFAELAAERVASDAALCDWAAALPADWLQGDLTWYSGAIQREVNRPKSVLLTHLFNHQTHHRGQVHAMLTQAGQATGDTDLFVVVEE
jgi:uncharacterized damage-inducible protein DinB